MNMNDLYDDGTYLKWNDVLSDWNPYTVKGVDLGKDDHYGISIDHKTIKEIVEEAVKEILKEEEVANEPITIRIEKYHMKHK
jgi:hypothetical protein